MYTRIDSESIYIWQVACSSWLFISSFFHMAFILRSILLVMRKRSCDSIHFLFVALFFFFFSWWCAADLQPVRKRGNKNLFVLLCRFFPFVFFITPAIIFTEKVENLKFFFFFFLLLCVGVWSNCMCCCSSTSPFDLLDLGYSPSPQPIDVIINMQEEEEAGCEH